LCQRCRLKSAGRKTDHMKEVCRKFTEEPLNEQNITLENATTCEKVEGPVSDICTKFDGNLLTFKVIVRKNLSLTGYILVVTMHVISAMSV